MKAGIYARVSRGEEWIQNPDNQIVPLRKLAESLGFEIAREYVDRASGGNSNRPSFQAMLNDSDNGEFNILLIWSLDRFSREGIIQTLSYIKRFRERGVAIKSLQEPWLDTRDDGMGNLLIAIFSWMAEQERKRISERVKAGLRGKKNVGKRGKDKKRRKIEGYVRRWDRIKKPTHAEQFTQKAMETLPQVTGDK